MIDWLESLRRQLDGLEAYRRQIEPALAPRFSAFHYMHTGETGLSRILADLLDQAGSHGQGAHFLTCFPARYWKEAVIGGSVSVRTEALTDRITKDCCRDTLIEFGRHVLAIENKPRAVDQGGQASDNLAHLSA